MKLIDCFKKKILVVKKPFVYKKSVYLHWLCVFDNVL